MALNGLFEQAGYSSAIGWKATFRNGFNAPVYEYALVQGADLILVIASGR
jgi:hypothetical protein